MTTVNIVGCGRVGQTIGFLLHATGDFQIQDILARSTSSADEAKRFIGAGNVRGSLQDMRHADVWVMTVPDAHISATAAALAQALPPLHGPSGARPTAFHCSGFTPASALEPLRTRGFQLASVHPILNFASPSSSIQQFKGTPCGLEGDNEALELLEPLLGAIGAVCFRVRTELKPIYHAAAVFASNFLIVNQGIAVEAWKAAGVPAELLPQIQSALLSATVRNVLEMGPSRAITGPAARGDTTVVDTQKAALSQWKPEAGALYAQMSTMARNLAVNGVPFSTISS